MLRRRMGLTYVSATFIGPRGRRALRVLVDSGASYSMISGSIARELGAQELEPVELELADGKTMVRRLCELRVEAAGRTAWTVVAMGRRGDAPVLGVHALPLWFRSSGAEALPAGLALFHCRVPTGDLRGGLEDLTGSWAIHPVPLPCSQTPAELSAPRADGAESTAPAPNTAKASAVA